MHCFMQRLLQAVCWLRASVLHFWLQVAEHWDSFSGQSVTFSGQGANPEDVLDWFSLFELFLELLLDRSSTIVTLESIYARDRLLIESKVKL